MILDRFLRYSMENQKKIKAVFLKDEKMEAQNILVCNLEQSSFTYTSAKQKKPKTQPFDALLCAGYARGDHGEGDETVCLKK